MSSLERFAVMWIFMLGLSYIFTAILSPSVMGDVYQGIALCSTMGALAILGLILRYWTSEKREELPNNLYTTIKYRPYISAGRVLLFILGVIEVYGGVASWTGVGIWNVPFEDKAIFQVSMAFLDLISAVFAFILATIEEVK